MTLLLVILAAILAIWGILNLLSGDILWGLVLLVLAAAVGPGGWSVFSRR